MVAKFCLVLLFCVGASLARAPMPVGDDDVTAKIKQLIIDTVKSIGDPYTVANKDLVIPTNDYISGDLDVTAATVTGLSTIDVPSLTIDVLALKATGEITFTYLTVDGSAHQDVTTKDDTYDSDVTADFTLNKITADFSGNFNIFTGHVENVSITFKLGSSTWKLTGWLGGDEASAEFAEYLTANFADRVNSDTTVFPELSKIIQNVINDYLDNHKSVAAQWRAALSQ